jgi:HEAT repeat protein
LDDYSEDLRPETLVPALSDADAEVRFEALGVLGDMEDQDAIRDIAKRMLNDPDDDVRSLAEGILDMEDDA